MQITGGEPTTNLVQLVHPMLRVDYGSPPRPPATERNVTCYVTFRLEPGVHPPARPSEMSPIT